VGWQLRWHAAARRQGITAAGPAFHDLMLAAMRGRSPAPLLAAALSEAEVCTLSGKRPGAACQHRRLEHFVRGREPSESCDMHVLVHLDAAGRESSARCGSATRVRERYPLEFRAWAEQTGRPLAGLNVSPSCPPEAEAPSAPRVSFPRPAQIFAIDPDGPTRQEIVLSAAANAKRLRFIIDGRPSAELRAPFRLPWRLTPGAHRIEAEAGGVRSALVSFEVSAP
jgi:penicillin-binding protein 1C